MDDLLQEGITAYKEGKLDEARKIFISVLKQNPENDRAWGWMYSVSEDNKERIYCLKQVLRINPKNEKARTLLNQLLNAPSPQAPKQITPPTKGTETERPVVSLKKCPYCAEEIQQDAIVCRYCGKDLTKPIVPRPTAAESMAKPDKKKSAIPKFVNVLIVVGAVIFCILLFWLFIQPNQSTSNIEPTSTPQESAWTACTMFIEKQIGLSMRDAQRYTPGGVTTLEDNLYRVEIYYAEQGDIYRCGILRNSNGDWQLLSLEVK